LWPARMKRFSWQALKSILAVLEPSPLDAEAQRTRIRTVERDVMLPVKVVFLLVIAYYLFASNWLNSVSTSREVALEFVQKYYWFYHAESLLIPGMLANLKRWQFS